MISYILVFYLKYNVHNIENLKQQELGMTLS